MEELDVAALTLEALPAGSLPAVPVAHVGFGATSQGGDQLLPGRPVSVFGFPNRNRAEDARLVEGIVESVETVTRGGRLVERLRLRGDAAGRLDGLDGGPLLDRDTGQLIGLYCGHDPATGAHYCADLSQLIQLRPEMLYYLAPGPFSGDAN